MSEEAKTVAVDALTQAGNAEQKPEQQQEQQQEQQPEQQPPKRRRRSGWGVPAPAPVMATPAPILKAPILKESAPKLVTPAPPIMVPPVTNNNVVGANSAGETNAANAMVKQMLIQQALQKMVAPAAPLPKQQSAHRIYIGSIHYELKETDIKTLFSVFGNITRSEMGLDPATGKSKGYCFLDFTDRASAEAALSMDGFDLAGRKIKVGLPKGGGASSLQEPAEPSYQQSTNSNPILAALLAGVGQTNMNTSQGNQVLLEQTSSLNAAAAASTAQLFSSFATGSNSEEKKCIVIRNVVNGMALKDLKPIFQQFGNILSMSFVPDPSAASSSQTAMVEYDSPATAESVVQAMNNFDLAGLPLRIAQTTKSVALTPGAAFAFTGPRQCSVVLQNMISMEDTNDPDLESEIAEEAGKYGKLVKIDIVTSDPSDVKVILKYHNSADASKALKALDGRAFANRPIIAKLAD